MNPGKEGQAWILLWDMRPRQRGHRDRHEGEVPSRLAVLHPVAQHVVQPCDVAVFRSFKSCIQAQASATLARSVFDGSFDDVVMHKAWRRQS